MLIRRCLHRVGILRSGTGLNRIYVSCSTVWGWSRTHFRHWAQHQIHWAARLWCTISWLSRLSTPRVVLITSMSGRPILRDRGLTVRSKVATAWSIFGFLRQPKGDADLIASGLQPAGQPGIRLSSFLFRLTSPRVLRNQVLLGTKPLAFRNLSQCQCRYKCWLKTICKPMVP